MNSICRSCKGFNLIQILDLGFAPPSNAFLEHTDLYMPETYYPLRLLYCEDCKLAQTEDFHKSEEIFTNHYPYLSSTSSSWCDHAKALVQALHREFNLGPKSLVVEIASNDGYLLQYLVALGIPCYGIEPTKIAADLSIAKGHEVFNTFLNLEISKSLVDKKGYADIVIANNVFAHVPDLLEFTKAAKNLLSPNGVLVVEVQYFPELIKNLAFDTIYHEHFSYFSLASINNLFSNCGLTLFRVERIPTHGGSLRLFARQNSGKDLVPSNVQRLLYQESLKDNFDELMSFQNKVLKKRNEVRNFISRLKDSKKQIIGLGAAAKGNTLLNYCGITSDDILLIMDSAASKHGKFAPGSHIPIKPFDQNFLGGNVEFIVLAWNLLNEFSDLLSNFSLPKSTHIDVLIPSIMRRKIFYI